MVAFGAHLLYIIQAVRWNKKIEVFLQKVLKFLERLANIKAVFY